MDKNDLRDIVQVVEMVLDKRGLGPSSPMAGQPAAPQFGFSPSPQYGYNPTPQYGIPTATQFGGVPALYHGGVPGPYTGGVPHYGNPSYGYGQPLLRPVGALGKAWHRFKVRGELKTALAERELFEEQAAGRESQRNDMINEAMAPYRLQSEYVAVQVEIALGNEAVAKAIAETESIRLKNVEQDEINKERQKKNLLLDLSIEKERLAVEQMAINLKAVNAN